MKMSENENIADKLNMKSFKEIVLTNKDRAIMHNIALESFMDKDFSYINTFDNMVQFSRKILFMTIRVTIITSKMWINNFI